MRLSTLKKRLQRPKKQLQKNPSKTLSLGREGELLARDYLQKNGYTCIETNTTSKIAEIDIIAVDGDTLVFVEVKTRSSTKYGVPEEAVTKRKQEKIKRLGLFYAQQNPHLPQKLRLDIISILTDSKGNFSIKLIQGI